jgi:hypothetical protein
MFIFLLYEFKNIFYTYQLPGHCLRSARPKLTTMDALSFENYWLLVALAINNISIRAININSANVMIIAKRRSPLLDYPKKSVPKKEPTSNHPFAVRGRSRVGWRHLTRVSAPSVSRASTTVTFDNCGSRKKRGGEAKAAVIASTGMYYSCAFIFMFVGTIVLRLDSLSFCMFACLKGTSSTACSYDF